MLYETIDDLKHEKEFMNKIQNTFDCKALKLPMLWKIDLVLTREKRGIAWAELKHRNYNFYDFPTWIIAEDKYVSGMKFHNWFLGGTLTTPKIMPFILFMRCLDNDYWCDLAKIKTKDIYYLEGFRATNDRSDFEDSRSKRRHIQLQREWFRSF